MLIAQYLNESNGPFVIATNFGDGWNYPASAVSGGPGGNFFTHGLPIAAERGYQAILVSGPVDKGPGGFFWIWHINNKVYYQQPGDPEPTCFLECDQADAAIILNYASDGKLSGFKN